MKYRKSDILQMVEEFQIDNASTDRYASFDYCYHYFHPTTDNDLLGEMEKSCLSLGFYLASWGMFRGSSFLLGNSVKYYEPLIRYFADLDRYVWDIDVDKYSDENIKIICELYKDIRSLIVNEGSSHLVIVTKILLGVFGFIPAYDTRFGDTFREIFQGKCGFRAVNSKSLKCIQRFYVDNKQEIDQYSSKIFVKKFSTGEVSNITYTKSKIIDMYGFTKGSKLGT